MMILDSGLLFGPPCIILGDFCDTMHVCTQETTLIEQLDLVSTVGLYKLIIQRPGRSPGRRRISDHFQSKHVQRGPKKTGTLILYALTSSKY